MKTASWARAVQIVYSQHRGSRNIEHIESAHTDADLELLKAAARQRLAGGQDELDLRLPGSLAERRCGVVNSISPKRDTYQDVVDWGNAWTEVQ